MNNVGKVMSTEQCTTVCLSYCFRKIVSPRRAVNIMEKREFLLFFFLRFFRVLLCLLFFTEHRRNVSLK